MKADVTKPCDNCEEFYSYARVALVSKDGELIDYRDLCPKCLRAAAADLEMSLSVRDKNALAAPFPHEEETDEG